MNYPPGFNHDKVNPSEPQLDEYDVVMDCPKCGNDVVREYWFKYGIKEEPTGDMQCIDCELRFDKNKESIVL